MRHDIFHSRLNASIFPLAQCDRSLLDRNNLSTWMTVFIAPGGICRDLIWRRLYPLCGSIDEVFEKRTLSLFSSFLSASDTIYHYLSVSASAPLQQQPHCTWWATGKTCFICFLGHMFPQTASLNVQRGNKPSSQLAGVWRRKLWLDKKCIMHFFKKASE